MSGVYTLPAGYLAVDGALATAAQHNDPLEDIEADMNVVRPITTGGTGASTPAGARAGLEIRNIATLGSVADRYAYTTGVDTWAEGTITAYARTLLDDVDAAAARTTLAISSQFLALAGDTMTGPLKTLELQETVVALAGTTPAINVEAGSVFTLSTTGNTTFTFTNPAATGTASAFTLRVTAGGTHTLTWPASVDWPGGFAPPAPASGNTDIFVFLTTDGGTTWYGFQSGDAMA